MFVGEPPWTVPESGPDTALSPGWLGVAEAFFSLFYTYGEPIAYRSYLQTQEPNVGVHLTYSYYEEGLRLWEVVVDNEAGTPLKAYWEVNLGAGVEHRSETVWATGGGIDDSLHMEIQLSPDRSVFISPRPGLISPVVSTNVTVWMWAPCLDPPQYRTVVFVLPGLGGANYSSPHVR